MRGNNFRPVEDSWDAQGLLVPGYSAWDCTAVRAKGRVCGAEVRRYRGQSDVECPNCGACYNAGGQRLRDNWRDNPAWRDDSVDDMTGYEIECLRREGSV